MESEVGPKIPYECCAEYGKGIPTIASIRTTMCMIKIVLEFASSVFYSSV